MVDVKTCSACEDPVGKSGAKGYCSKHYWRWKTYGDPLGGAWPSLADRHAAATDRRGPDDCWEWTAARDKDGYGVISSHSQSVRAHRFAYEQSTGLSPDGLVICHTCDNPPCQNPGHLFAGTVTDNNRDKVRKGRSIGNRTGNLGTLRRRLTSAQVDEIRFYGNPYRGSRRELAERFGISQEHVRRIQNGTRR